MGLPGVPTMSVPGFINLCAPQRLSVQFLAGLFRWKAVTVQRGLPEPLSWWLFVWPYTVAFERPTSITGSAKPNTISVRRHTNLLPTKRLVWNIYGHNVGGFGQYKVATACFSYRESGATNVYDRIGENSPQRIPSKVFFRTREVTYPSQKSCQKFQGTLI